MSSPLLRTSGIYVIAVALAGCASSQGASSPSPERAPDVTAEDISRTSGESVEEILKGRVAGVTVARAPDGGLSVRIRGATSFTGSAEPLYVLDGLPIEAGPGGSLVGVDVYDIESIRVLKDPAETAMYGMRGANGVVLITTKRGKTRKPSD